MSALILEDAKLHLNITGDKYDVELQDVIDAAEGIISGSTGPLEPKSVTDRVRSNGLTLTLTVTPVLSLTTVVAVGAVQSVEPSNLHISPSGVVSWASGLAGFTSGVYDVTYLAGRETVPADLLYAVKEQVRHLWSPQRGPSRPGSAASPSTTPGYLVPNRVAEAMEPHVQDFGFA